MISDDDLLLYYYRDGLDAAERERIAKALSEQPELAMRLHRLIARLDAVSQTPEVPVPEHVRQRWQAALDRAAAGVKAEPKQSRGRHLSTFRWQVAAAAIVGALLTITLRVALRSPPDDLPDPDSTLVATAPAANDSSAYARGLRLHLVSTEGQIANLDEASGEERAQLVETIIAQNRLYAAAAERANQPQLAGALRAFTPLLERLAIDDGTNTADDVAQLTFELNVIQARLAAAMANKPSAQAQTL